MYFPVDGHAEAIKRAVHSFARRGRTLLDGLDSGNEEVERMRRRLKFLEKRSLQIGDHPGPLYDLMKKAWHSHHRLQGILADIPASPVAGILSEGEVPGESSWAESEDSRADEQLRFNPVPIGRHTLPPLPYPYNALEPHIDEKTMRLHHDKHHKSYVDGLNRAERMMLQARRTGNFDLIKHWEREAAFNGAGHYLHTLFWETMSPDGGGEPSGELRKQITRDFGSFLAFKQHFSQAAEKVEGSGWAILVWSPRSQRLQILQAEKHQNLTQWDVIPLLPLDVWEHAYYLKYQNNRKAYIDA
jgi:Fe-Mn family superoxide dismutase